jgi:predicted short-subunit dehydrogenase-like oxidoreductase (DUF2520 family)
MPREQSLPRRRPARVLVTLFGAGRFARALVPLLGEAGYPVVAVASLRSSSARSVARLAPGARATTRPEVALRGAALVILAVPDREIGPLARRLADVPAHPWKGTIVLHPAGSLGVAPLAPLAALGAGCGVMHPLQCLGDPALVRELLPGSRARVEGDRRGGAAARRLARALGMKPLRLAADLSDDDRAAYHAAATLLSGDLVSLLSLGLELMEQAGAAPGPALDGLVALARGTLLQTGCSGLTGALTGPVSRGDVETLRTHLRRMKRVRTLGEIHRLLSLRLARLARATGDSEAAKRVEGALKSPGRAGGGTV